jgi:hypothetical protein
MKHDPFFDVNCYHPFEIAHEAAFPRGDGPSATFPKNEFKY